MGESKFMKQLNETVEKSEQNILNEENELANSEEKTMVKYTVLYANYGETLPADYRKQDFADKDRAIEYIRVIIERFDFVELFKIKETWIKKP